MARSLLALVVAILSLCTARAVRAAPIVCTPPAAQNAEYECRSRLAKPEQFTLNASRPAAGTCKQSAAVRFVPPVGAATDDVANCVTADVAADPVVYTCSFDPAKRARVTNGKLSTKICDHTLSVEVGTEGNPNPQGTGDAPPPGLAFLPPSKWAETLTNLGLPLAGHRFGNYYGSDVAVLFFDADATPFFPIPDVIDEDDDIYVVVVDYENRLQGARVSIQGCNRPPVEPRIYGGSVSAAGRSVSTGDTSPKIDVIARAFGKCAGATSGGPQLVIERDGKQNIATIPVNPLYRLSVGIAFGYDATEARTFAVRAPAGTSLTRVAESNDAIGVTPMVYVSLYPWARDFRKTRFFQLQRLQVFLGMDTEDFLDNIVVGVGYELTMGLDALVGWRALTKQKVLAEGSGLQNGSSFDGTTESLPLREKWETGSVFVGVGLSNDLFTRLR